MNSLWTLLDWLLPSLPSVRLSDDLADPEAALTRTPTDNPSAFGYTDVPPSSYPPHRFRTNQAVDRHWEPHQKEREKERDRERDRERERQREHDRRKASEHISALEGENVSLKQKLEQLEKQLKANQQTIDSLRVLVPPGLSTSGAPPEVPLTPPNNPKDFGKAYDTLLSYCNVTTRALQDRSEEVASLQSFLSKTDDFSGAQLIQALRDLNSEIVQVAASIAEEFASSFNRKPEFKRPSDIDLVATALGPVLTKLLSRDHSADPTLVQFAIQAWEVVCIGRALDTFCFGAPAPLNEALSGIFRHMHLSEPQPTTSRWRALTHAHARSLVSSAKHPNVRSAFETLTETNLRGILVILVLSGCTDPRAIHHEPLRERFGPTIARISERAERITLAMKEGVMSAAFDVVWYGHQPGSGTEIFDQSKMDNVYEGHGSEQGGVLCTVELGLVCSRKVAKEGNGNENGSRSEHNGVNGVNRLNGHLASVSLNGSNTHAHGHANHNGIPNGHAKKASRSGHEDLLSKNLLLKPKVLLRSVEEIIWP
ncbi:hypothetical protein QCA50_005691 [Cerrena zonata]|uniref:BZIP domain-containing protein n=1 Tax=Cerrena zonata TaxID=2478898 RepID=A0AAW0GDU3_9APHY